MGRGVWPPGPTPNAEEEEYPKTRSDFVVMKKSWDVLQIMFQKGV